MPSRSAAGVRTGVRVVVAGDRGTGKSSLISAAASDAFPEYVPAVLPPTRLPSDFYPDGVPVTIVDTSSRYWFGTFSNIYVRLCSLIVFVDLAVPDFTLFFFF